MQDTFVFSLFILGKCGGAFAVTHSYFIYLQIKASVNTAAHLHQAGWQEHDDLPFSISDVSNSPAVSWNAGLAGAPAHSQQRRCYHKSLVSSSTSWQRCLVGPSLRLSLPFTVPHQVPFWKSWLSSCWFLVLDKKERSLWLTGSLGFFSQGSWDSTSQQRGQTMTRGLAWTLPWITAHLCQLSSRRRLAPPLSSGSQPFLGESFQ